MAGAMLGKERKEKIHAPLHPAVPVTVPPCAAHVCADPLPQRRSIAYPILVAQQGA